MNPTSYLLVLLVLLRSVFSKSIVHRSLDIVGKQIPSICNIPDMEQCTIDPLDFDLTTLEGQRDYQQAVQTVNCQDDCVSASIQFQVCLGVDEDDATTAIKLSCTKNGEQFCKQSYNQGITSGDIILGSCNNTNQNCSSDCRRNLMAISSFWGCCAATFANTVLFPTTKETFERCGVRLEDPCSDSDSDSDLDADSDSGGSYVTPMFFSIIIFQLIAAIMF